jgi:prephenate dehydratase
MTGRKKIVFQGEPGANSHIACREVYPDYEALPCQTFEDCFAAIESGAADLGMIPVENSIAGRVADIHHLLPQSNLHIIGEYFLPIRHQLMALKGVSLDELKSAQSHPQALGQCRIALRNLGLAPVVGADTAGSARQIAEAGERSRGAIASRLAAEIYGLDILKADIEDESHNTTRFIILSREDLRAAFGVGPIMTTFVFEVRNVPAALYKALGGFATNGINMTRLESYMVGGTFTATQFLADVEGHPEEPGLARALEELAFFASYRIQGVYRSSPFRARVRDADTARTRPAVRGM